MKILRIVLVLAVIAYAGWLAWPFLSPFLEGAPPDAASMRSGAVIEGGGVSESALWIVAVILYVIAALMLGAGNPRAAVAYFLGFLADAALRLAIDRHGSGAGPSTMSADGLGPDIAARSAEAVAPAGLSVDPTWLILGVLLVVGVLVVLVVRRKRPRRAAGQLAL